MDPQILELLEVVTVFTILSGVTLGIKLMVWGKGPIRRVRGGENDSTLEQRVADLEDLLEQRQHEILDRHADLEERLEFAERMLTQNRAKELEAPSEPRVPTPD